MLKAQLWVSGKLCYMMCSPIYNDSWTIFYGVCFWSMFQVVQIKCTSSKVKEKQHYMQWQHCRTLTFSHLSCASDASLMDILTFSFETIVVFSDIFVSVIEIIGVSSNCLQLPGIQIICRYKKHKNIFFNTKCSGIYLRTPRFCICLCKWSTSLPDLISLQL